MAGVLPATGRNVTAILVDADGGRYVLRWYRRNPARSAARYRVRQREGADPAAVLRR